LSFDVWEFHWDFIYSTGFQWENHGKRITASGLDLDLPDDGITEVGVHEVVMGCWIEEIHSFPNRQLISQPNYGKIHHAM
jgi:hypothetical protein